MPVNGLSAAFLRKATSYRFLEWSDFVSSGSTDLLCDLIAAEPCDLAFYHLQQPVDAKIVKAASGFRINWTWDFRRPTPFFYQALAPYFDVTLFPSREDVVPRASYMPPHVDTTYYNGIGPVDKLPPVVFIGNNFGDRFEEGASRRAMVDTLRTAFPNDFILFGHGWGAGTVPTGQRFEKLIYDSAKVVINHNHFVADGYTSDRMMRAMSSGRAVVSSYVPNGVPFLDGSYETWRSDDELVYKVRRLLEDEKHRNELAHLGQSAVTSNYSWDCFVDKLFAHVHEAK